MVELSNIYSNLPTYEMYDPQCIPVDIHWDVM